MKKFFRFLRRTITLSDNSEVELLEEESEKVEHNISEPNRSRQITFDITLPSSHKYLGDSNDWQESSGRTVHEDGMELCLPILALSGVVLMPGQVLPLNLHRNEDIAMIKHCLDQDRTFGHLNKLQPDSEIRSLRLGKIGTTAEILAYREAPMSYIVKTIGRQRFKVLELRNDIGGIVLARVKILSEEKMSNLLSDICPNSYRKYLFRPQESSSTISSRDLKRKSFEPSVLTAWPTWVHDQYNCHILMQKIKNELLNWFDLDKVPTDSCSFSYWVASTLPLDDMMRLEILSIRCAEQRLRCVLYIMKNCTVMCCKRCTQQVANFSDVFSMSTDGPLGTYVNPGGHVHETLTMHHATNLELDGRPSTQSSWFPGYAWTICNCKTCHHHMGWKFTRVKKDPKLKPNKFWGLCRTRLFPLFPKVNKPEDQYRPVV